jgi:hypothetical protein
VGAREVLVERKLVIRTFLKYEAIIVACFIAALYALYFSYPPYVVPIGVSHMAGVFYFTIAGLLYGFEDKMGKQHPLLRLFIRIVIAFVIFTVETVRTARE